MLLMLPYLNSPQRASEMVLPTPNPIYSWETSKTMTVTKRTATEDVFVIPPVLLIIQAGFGLPFKFLFLQQYHQFIKSLEE